MTSVIDWLNGCLKSIDHEAFKDVIKVSGEVGVMSDGNPVVASDISKVTLTLETPSGDKRILKAVAKLEPPPGPGRAMADECSGFYNETMMYKEILQQMKELMSEVADNSYIWPENYHCGDNKFLLEDLGEAGYKIVPTYKLLDVNHSLLVMKALGKFHALSMVMDRRGILDKTKLQPCCLTQGPQFVVSFYTRCMGAMAEGIKSWGPEWSSVPDRMRKFTEGTKGKLQELAHATEMKWKVLNHGDFTIRNMLFHYKPNSDIPDVVKFVDFQTVHWNDPGFDVSNLLYSSMLPQVRDDNMDLLLNTYVESLTATCNQHNYQGNIPTVEYISSSVKSLKFLTTCLSLSAVPLFIIFGKLQKKSTSDEAPTTETKKISLPKFSYDTDDVKEVMQYEVERCIRENIF